MEMKSDQLIAVGVGLALYCWLVWFKSKPTERTPKQFGSTVLWTLLIAAVTLGFAIVRGSLHGYSLAQLALLDVSPGKLKNSLVVASTFVTLCVCMVVHLLMSVLSRLTSQWSRRGET
jgi:hypothetical protein